MPNPDQNEPFEPGVSPSPAQTSTVVVSHEGEDAMGARSMTVGRYEEIRRRLAEGRGVREIARALSCARDTVRKVRDGLSQSPDLPKAGSDPLWMRQLKWPAIIHDLGLGHPLKFIWEEKAQQLTTYSNFWKQFYRKFPQYREASVTAREFEPGERVEVDYAGDALEWIELKSGEMRKAFVFVAGRGFSQLLFAWAAEDMKSRNWLGAHRRMFTFYGGVPHVTVPDCLKQGVLKCHLYDPDLNPGYAQLASQYSTAVVPARPDHPKDKAIVEGLVKILMRYARFRFRRTRFTSVSQINQALSDCVERINARCHTRFGVSRRERFDVLERSALKALPLHDYDNGEWTAATLHADCYVLVEAVLYSAPHIHRHKRLRIKLTENQVEIFLNLERLAIHPRSRHRDGRRIKIDAHFPPASQAYYEATPQKLLSQSRFIHPELNRLFVELFNADVYGHLRRCQGFVRSCTKEINTAGHEVASLRIAAAIATMRRYDKFRVPYFQALLAQARRQTGVGKTFIAQATGLHACACGKSVLYMTVTTWLENVALARSSGTYLRYRDKIAKPDVLILDDMGMRKLSATEAQDLCEILEERSIGKSTVFTTQLPLDHWSEVIGDPVIADAIRDRLEHAALVIQITGESYRGVKARKLASKKKDA